MCSMVVHYTAAVLVQSKSSIARQESRNQCTQCSMFDARRRCSCCATGGSTCSPDSLATGLAVSRRFATASQLVAHRYSQAPKDKLATPGRETYCLQLFLLGWSWCCIK